MDMLAMVEGRRLAEVGYVVGSALAFPPLFGTEEAYCIL